MDRSPPRPWLARAGVVLLAVVLLIPAGVSAVTHEPTSLQTGTIEEAANGSTVVGIQGFHFQGKGSAKKPARVASVGPEGTFQWTYLGGELGATWVYDVDPLPDGNVLVVSTRNRNGGDPPPPDTVVYEFDPETRERVWTQQLDIEDTHDVDLINGDELLVANMRNYDEESGVSNDRLFVYNLTRDEVTWEWTFRNHYPNDTDGGFKPDWTHVNDVDKVGEGRYLASPRNFDQVIVVNRSTREIEMRLGADENYSVLHEQHNPDLLVSEEGRPTVLVADSENDRVVEYERRCSGDPALGASPPADCHWNRTWEVGSGQLNWPRDADRLPDGNTLITDTLNHRVVEVTPEGEIVWEYYATWGPYDAERVAHGGSSNGPTIADQGKAGTYSLHGSAGIRPGTGEERTVDAWLVSTFSGTPVESQARSVATRWAHVVPWVKPVWMTGWDFLLTALAGLLLAGWAVAELVYHRRAVATRARRLVG